ncbi:class I SAM-dependent methyltransferase [Halobaculum litoreum]|uniref:Class I SAM-dependent methyltransferase n=1 Tax=Halobaculum litoreum TaxID=3031998 RepID=A0ABD5XSB7_9EURY
MSDVLSDVQREKLDTRPDESFYDAPRYVTHADDGFLDRLTELYAEEIAPGARVFDAMSSWVSHLPDAEYGTVIGHGLNAEEAAANDRLDERFVQNLNDDRTLPLADASVDAVTCALSVQYLQHPAAVFREFARVLADDGVLVVSFSNRMFPTKAVRAWREASMDGRVDLVRSYVDAAGSLAVRRVVRERPATDPFYAVVATRTPR